MKHLLLSLAIFLFYTQSTISQEVNGVIISDSTNLTVMKVWGTHQERGYAYGYLLGEKISEMVSGYMIPTFGPYMEAARQIIINGEDLSIDEEYLLEAMAVVNGMNDAGTNYANIDYVDGLVFNAFLDIVKILGLSADKPGCSSLMNWGDATEGTALGGQSVISRHLDWTPDQTLINNQVLLIHLPAEEDEQAWAMIGFTGQMSVLSGFNRHMGVFQHMMSDFNGNAVSGSGYEPIWLTLRKSIEKTDYNNDGICNTEDLRAAIQDNPMGFADGFIISALASATSDQDSLIAIVAELAPQAPLITFRSNAYPDDIPGDNLYAANFEIARNNHNHYCSRYYAVINALGEGYHIGQEENWEIMRDHSNGSTGNLQFMQFIPEEDIFRMSVYQNGNPAYQNIPQSYNITSLFNFPVGYNETIEDSEILIYPIPAKDQLHASFPKQYLGKPFTLRTLKGKIIRQETILQQNTMLDLKDLNSGIYFLIIDEVYSQKILVR